MQVYEGNDFENLWQDVAKRRAELAKKATKVEEVGSLSLSLSLSLSHSLSCLLTHYSACPYTQAKSVAASSSWTIVRIWFGITNKLRITGASTKVLTAVTIYYCPLFTEKKIYSLPASTHTGGDCCHFYYTRSELIRDTRLTALYLLDFFVFFLLSRRQVSNVTQPRTSPELIRDTRLTVHLTYFLFFYFFLQVVDGKLVMSRNPVQAFFHLWYVLIAETIFFFKTIIFVSFFFHFSISGMFSSAETVTTWIPPVE